MPNISSGSDSVDAFIGGYPDCVLTMIYGEPGSGKTTLAMHAALIQTKYGRKVLYLDSEGTFSLDRLRQLDPLCDSYLSSIFLLHPTSFLEQERQILALSSKVSLVVLDTIGYHYRTFWKEDPEVANASLVRQLQFLSSFSRTHHIPVLLINQVYSNIDRGGVRNVGGNIVRKWCKYILLLEKNPGRMTLEEPDAKSISLRILERGLEVF